MHTHPRSTSPQRGVHPEKKPSAFNDLQAYGPCGYERLGFVFSELRNEVALITAGDKKDPPLDPLVIRETMIGLLSSGALEKEKAIASKKAGASHPKFKIIENVLKRDRNNEPLACEYLVFGSISSIQPAVNFTVPPKEPAPSVVCVDLPELPKPESAKGEDGPSSMPFLQDDADNGARTAWMNSNFAESVSWRLQFDESNRDSVGRPTHAKTGESGNKVTIERCLDLFEQYIAASKPNEPINKMQGEVEKLLKLPTQITTVSECLKSLSLALLFGMRTDKDLKLLLEKSARASNVIMVRCRSPNQKAARGQPASRTTAAHAYHIHLLKEVKVGYEHIVTESVGLLDVAKTACKLNVWKEEARTALEEEVAKMVKMAKWEAMQQKEQKDQKDGWVKAKM